MSQERSAEWLRGAVESHINTCNLITSITSATASHPARQGLMAAGKELHNQLDRYRALLAEAEAREALQGGKEKMALSRIYELASRQLAEPAGQVTQWRWRKSAQRSRQCIYHAMLACPQRRR